MPNPEWLHCEIVEQIEGFYLCWVTVATGLDVKVKVPIADLAEVRKNYLDGEIGPGDRFLYSLETAETKPYAPPPPLTQELKDEIEKLCKDLEEPLPGAPEGWM